MEEDTPKSLKEEIQQLTSERLTVNLKEKCGNEMSKRHDNCQEKQRILHQLSSRWVGATWKNVRTVCTALILDRGTPR